MNQAELSRFLIKAKKATYASGEEGRTLIDGSRELVYDEGSLFYRDRYFGFNPFSGEEVVFEDDEAVWVMNYHGGMTSNRTSPGGVYKFLRVALGGVEEQTPFRGPESFSVGNFSYASCTKGDLSSFTGKETIFYIGEGVYTLVFHGGFVKGRERA